MSPREKTKLTLRLNKHLIEQAKRYAAARNISVSELVETFFLHLETLEDEGYTPLVRQLTGILRDDIDVEAEYGRYLMEKYGQ